MMHAYDEVYLDKARVALGRMLDFAVYDLNYDIVCFMEMFNRSGVGARFGEGDYELLVGMSGVELAYEVLEQAGVEYVRVQPNYTMNRSREYWLGWALAYYQWRTSMSFSEILQHVPAMDMLALYSPYHEMDIRQFVDKMNELYRAANPETNLKRLRNRLGISQRELSELSGVPMRTIQQYEQRQKSINKAKVEYLVMLSKGLCCEIEDLVEKCE